ncbi:MAG: apolipoprotein N-acyltransferase [Bdellovibrionales bacterium]|nr:apolipoprotein N-acyltransferase [Bdellovibrionales bacterium]
MTYAENSKLALIVGTLTGFALGLAWIFPGSAVAALLGWGAAFGLIALAELNVHRLKASVLCGSIAFCMSTWWFFDSVQRFTESSMVVAAALTLPFLLWHVAQFVLFVALYRLLPATLGRFGLRAALAWGSIECFWPRLFPWTLGNTQLGLPLFAQSAELLGAFGVSFVMLFFAAQFYAHVTKKDVVLSVYGVIGLFALVTTVSWIRMNTIDSSLSKRIHVGVVQAASSDQRLDRHQKPLEQRLLDLTEQVASEADFVLWPERSLNAEIHESIGHRDNDPRLPRLKTPAALITGVNTYRPPTKRFNSVMLIQADGKVPVPYHKRYLMPFGEFLPLPYLFEWLGIASLAPKSSYVAGTTATVFEIKGKNSSVTAKIAPFICYEDLRPTLAQNSTTEGANLLLDLSAGSWAHAVVPLYQHQAIAAFRAIETRKSFVRLSAHGPSSYIDPTGKLHQIFAAEEEGAKIVSVPISYTNSTYSIMGAQFPKLIAAITVLFCLFNILSTIHNRLSSKEEAQTIG